MTKKIEPPYSARVIEDVPTGPGCWKYQKIGVFEGERQIGEYVRNYSSFMRTFFPFQKDGKWLALYSKDYTSSRLMSLPDCQDLGGEERNTFGFCPVEFYVPQYTPGPEYDKPVYAQFGFVAGCVWGDDSSWKIQYLDLSEAELGILRRDDRFGYIELPRELHLPEAVDMTGYDPPDDGYWVQIACAQLFDVRENARKKKEQEEAKP